MKGKLDWRDGLVTAVHDACSDIRVIEFAVESETAGDVFRFEPGSHTNIEFPLRGGVATRSYSCLPSRPGTIRIGVKKQARSRGGSDYVRSLEVGAQVRLTRPENRFELSWRAPAYLLVAGGVGITPLLGMADALAGGSAEVSMAYAVSRRDQLAFADELSETLGERLSLHVGEDGGRLDLRREIAKLPEEGELYICGPHRMLEDAKAIWAEAGRPASRLRYEVFGEYVAEDAERPFTVRIANSDMAVQVLPGQSMLDALTDAGVDMIWDCQRGECGLCAVDILELDGQVDHRDVFFSAEQKAENTSLCTCVSRLTGGSATIDTGLRPGKA